MWSKVNLVFCVHSEEYKKWKAQKNLPPRKYYTAGPIKTCVHKGRHGDAKKLSLIKLTSSSRQEEKKETKSANFYKLTNLNVLAVLLKDMQMGCNDAV